MTGLDKIIEKILLQSQENCNAILNDASAQVKKIISEAREKANKESSDIIAKANAEAKKIEAVAKSSAESITRNRYLEIRNAILNDIISAAYLSISSASPSLACSVYASTV